MSAGARLSDGAWRVMEVLWDAPKGGLSAKEIHATLYSSKGWALSTVRTLLRRLLKQGVIARAREDRLDLYWATLSREDGIAWEIEVFRRRALERQPACVLRRLMDGVEWSPEDRRAILRAFGVLDPSSQGSGPTQVPD